MSEVPRPDDDDPEPVVVVVGGPDWACRARFADILLARADRVDGAVRMRDELFDNYPGLSVVALCSPRGAVVVGRRRGPLLMLSPVALGAMDAAEAAARVVYFGG